MSAKAHLLVFLTILSAVQQAPAFLCSSACSLSRHPLPRSRCLERSHVRHGSRGIACSGGQPTWIPWTGTHGRMVDTEKDDILQRMRCQLCRGSGTIACRLCSGKGYKALRSRTLRNASAPLYSNEVLSCDPTTGLMRAVEICACVRCGEKGKIACTLCGGSGGRETNVTFRNFTSMTSGESKGDDDDDEDVHRYTGGRR
mmetsp:Transcript_646/g.1416  ORF Transcript_646/g.1416 Transcript_646/m.1416 type:complete len:200 (-) Transcript_646:159-758(-)